MAAYQVVVLFLVRDEPYFAIAAFGKGLPDNVSRRHRRHEVFTDIAVVDRPGLTLVVGTDRVDFREGLTRGAGFAEFDEPLEFLVFFQPAGSIYPCLFVVFAAR